jgi:hypothetical protein
MMDRIREKMNKFSVLTYDPTKAWLSQLLNSGETEFLTGFITLVFEKAASEPAFCALYARLISELRAGFSHLDTELRRIFGQFMPMFESAASEPDVGTEQYAEFVALRERRRYRRGYAAFIGEVATQGVLTKDDVLQTCSKIMDGLDTAKASGHGALCEEFADCLTSLIRACSKELLNPAVLVPRMRSLSERKEGFPNKARFALMDVIDILDKL